MSTQDPTSPAPAPAPSPDAPSHDAPVNPAPDAPAPDTSVNIDDALAGIQEGANNVIDSISGFVGDFFKNSNVNVDIINRLVISAGKSVVHSFIIFVFSLFVSVLDKIIQATKSTDTAPPSAPVDPVTPGA
jgi:hypothetical protein